MGKMTKVCTKCGIEKSCEEFPIKKRRINIFARKYKQRSFDGFSSWCRKCYKEVIAGWSAKNMERIKETNHKWRAANKDRKKRVNRLYCEANPEKVRRNNLKKSRKFRSMPKGKLSNNISRAIRFSLRNGKNGHHWETLVDYTVSDLQHHLQNKFLPGMTWENMGKWHIDHIIPISVFNFDTPNHPDFRRCWSLKNLRPLWAKDNKSKGNKLNQPFQPSLRM